MYNKIISRFLRARTLPWFLGCSFLIFGLPFTALKQTLADTPPPELFFEVSLQPTVDTETLMPHVLRSRFVDINWHEIETYPDTITLNLFDDTTLIVEGRILSQESQSNYSWHGYVLGEESSEVSLAIRGKTLTGGIHTQDKLYQIRPAGGGLHIIGDIDWRSLPREGHPVFLPPK